MSSVKQLLTQIGTFEGDHCVFSVSVGAHDCDLICKPHRFACHVSFRQGHDENVLPMATYGKTPKSALRKMLAKLKNEYGGCQ